LAVVAKLKLEMAAKEEADSYLLFSNGLPPMSESQQVGQSDPRSKSRKNTDGKFIETQTFELLRDSLKNPAARSTVRIHYQDTGRAPLVWNREAGAEFLVLQFLQDATIAADLADKLEFALRAQALSDAMAILPRFHSLPVGILEVKPPHHELGTDNIAGQVFDSLQLLSTFNGLRCCFGILTNYKTWRVCWLNTDANVLRDVLAFKNVQELAVLDQQVPTKGISVYWPTNREVYCSRDYAFDDPELPLLLTTCLYKMYAARNTASELRTFDPNRAYLTCSVGKGGSTYEKLKTVPGNETFDISTSSTIYYMCQSYYVQSHHRVWKVFDTKGRICIAKFFSSSDLDEMAQEKRCWEILWGDVLEKPRSLDNLGGQPALLLPYIPEIFSFETQPPRDDVVACLRSMAGKGVEHRDLHWRHVGRRDKDIVIIDLGDVDLQPQPTEEWISGATKRMVECLSWK